LSKASAQNPFANLSCWVMSEGHAGMENQCRGLAEALGFTPLIKRVAPRPPWIWMPAALWPCPFLSLKSDSDRLEPPWPDVLITCGRRSVPLAMAIRRKSGNKTFTIHIQDPTVASHRFDLIVAPAHDGFTGDNVIVAHGALHRVTRDRLTADAKHFAPLYADLPRPLIGVLIGGPNRRYKAGPIEMAQLAEKLKRLCAETGGALAVTPSRRTGAGSLKAFTEGLGDTPAVIWDNQGDNPYFGILGLADIIVVTCDSISMVTEACVSGKPVYVEFFPGGSKRFEQFHAEMIAAGYTRPFSGRLENFPGKEMDNMGEVSARIAEKFGDHRQKA